jgi:ribosomal protein L24E
MEDNEVRSFGYCKNCEEKVTDNCGEYYVNEDGEIFCCIECVLEHNCIEKIEV